MICLYSSAQEPHDSRKWHGRLSDKKALYLTGLLFLRDFVNTTFCGLCFSRLVLVHKEIKHVPEFVVGVLV